MPPALKPAPSHCTAVPALLARESLQTGAGQSYDALLPAGVHAYSRPREYRVYLPKGLSAHKPAPLLIVLHGCLQSHLDMQTITGFDALADREGFIVAYPYVTSYLGLRVRNCWGWWKRAHRRRGRGEVEDIWRIVESIGTHHAVDAARIHVCGLSAGAAMSVAALVAHSDRFASGASVAGLAYGEGISAVAMSRHAGERHKPLRSLMASMRRQLQSDRPPPLLIVHSTGDTMVSQHAAGSLRSTWQSAWGLDHPSWSLDGAVRQVPWQATGWTRNDGIQPLVELRIEGVPHGWFGGAPGPFSYPDAPCVSELIWWHCVHGHRGLAPARVRDATGRFASFTEQVLGRADPGSVG